MNLKTEKQFSELDIMYQFQSRLDQVSQGKPYWQWDKDVKNELNCILSLIWRLLKLECGVSADGKIEVIEKLNPELLDEPYNMKKQR